MVKNIPNGDGLSKNSEDLVRRFRQRDPRVLADMYNIYWRLVFFLIARLVNNAQVAEDLVQECFLRAWDRPDLFAGNDDRALGQWLMAIARNHALGYLGRATSTVDPFSVAVDPTPETAALTAGNLPDFSEQHRQVLELAYCEGLFRAGMCVPQTEECQVTIPIGAVVAV
jgi:RNA polymerase sigma factor (sigma-70 family)